MSGRSERGDGLTARQRRPHLSHYYRHRAGHVHPGDFEWKITLRRPGANKKNRVLRLGRVVTFLEWVDGGPAFTGSITLQRPDPDESRSLPIARGDRVALAVFHRHRWRRFWTMTVEGEPTIDVGVGSISATLGDDLWALDKGERQWDFKKNDEHKHGWTADEIATHVCHKEGVSIGRLAKGTKQIEKLSQKSSGLAVIKKAYADERDETGVHFIMRFRFGKFNVLPVRRNKILYEIKNVEESANTSGTASGSRPTTVIEAHGRVHDDKVTVKVVADRAAAKFGRITKEQDYGRVGSRDAVRRKALRDLAEGLDPHRQVELTFPMIPFIERGDTVRWRNHEPGWHGKSRLSANRQFGFVTAVTHSLTPEEATTDLTLSQHDPMVQIYEDRDKAKRNDKQRNRDGKGGGSGTGSGGTGA